MSAEGLGKAGWRRRVVSERRARLGLDRSSVSDAVPVVSADLASAPGWEAFLPGLGEFVAAFASMADEPSTGRLLAWLAAREVRVLVPAPGPSLGDLQWAEVEPATCALPAARPGRPPEPPGPRLAPAALRSCRLVLVPALAVDRSGTRLGRGGGWYDRALVHAHPDALILAVCFPWELLAAGALPREPHDRVVDGAATPAGLTLFGACRE